MSDIDYQLHGSVALITINRADRMNSLDFAANDSLVEAWRQFEGNDDLRVAVVTGAGDKAFCAGADLKTYTMDFATRPAPEFRQRFTQALIENPHVASTLEVLDIAGRPAALQEWLSGLPSSDWPPLAAAVSLGL